MGATSSRSKTTVADLTYEYRSSRYRSLEGRPNVTTWSIPRRAFDRSRSECMSSEGEALILKKKVEAEGSKLSSITEIWDVSEDRCLASLEMDQGHKLALDIRIWTRCRMRNDNPTGDDGRYLWATVSHDKASTRVFVQTGDIYEYVFLKNRKSGMFGKPGYVLFHGGHADKPVVVVDPCESVEAPGVTMTTYTIGPQADPVLMLCLVVCAERVRLSRKYAMQKLAANALQGNHHL